MKIYIILAVNSFGDPVVVSALKYQKTTEQLIEIGKQNHYLRITQYALTVDI